jgi:hypothetical protein
VVSALELLSSVGRFEGTCPKQGCPIKLKPAKAAAAKAAVSFLFRARKSLAWLRAFIFVWRRGNHLSKPMMMAGPEVLINDQSHQSKNLAERPATGSRP